VTLGGLGSAIVETEKPDHVCPSKLHPELKAVKSETAYASKADRVLKLRLSIDRRSV
jgi:hypothetical protein